MRVLVIGAGALGGYYGRLCGAGRWRRDFPGPREAGGAIAA